MLYSAWRIFCLFFPRFVYMHAAIANVPLFCSVCKCFAFRLSCSNLPARVMWVSRLKEITKRSKNQLNNL